MNTKKILRFCGNVKDLNSMGYIFGKYYSNNYIAYNLPHPEYETIDLIVIWKSGRDLKIGNLSYKFNVPLYEALIKFNSVESILNSLKACEDTINKGWNPICIKMLDDKITFINADEHMTMEDVKSCKKRFDRLIIKSKEKSFSKQNMLDRTTRELKYHMEQSYYESYLNSKSYIISDKIINALFELHKNNMLQIENIDIDPNK